MIRPVSLNNNSFNFRAANIDDNEDVTKNDFKPAYRNSHEKNQDIKNGFLVGTLFGLILGTTGTSLYKDNQIDNLLKDMAAELTYTDSVRVDDLTNDSVPDIILEGKDGGKTVYDLTSGSIYFSEGNILEEKVR